MPKLKYKEKLIKRTYRISQLHDKKVKKKAKNASESKVIRDLIDTIK